MRKRVDSREQKLHALKVSILILPPWERWHPCQRVSESGETHAKTQTSQRAGKDAGAPRGQFQGTSGLLP